MRLLIAGSRTINNTFLVERCFDQFKHRYLVDEIVEGGARGVDYCASILAQRRRFWLTTMEADWDQYGKRAGFIRNEEMADYLDPKVDGVLIIWDGHSRGTHDMIDRAIKHGFYVEVYDRRGRRIRTIPRRQHYAMAA